MTALGAPPLPKAGEPIAADLTNDPRVRPFRLGDGADGCLLLHGFTGTPGEMRRLGEHLAAQGFSVLAPCLPGHGTRVEDLQRTGWRDWFAAAQSAWDDLGRTTARRTIAGLSMGALLALHLAHERPGEVAALALLAPALELRNQRQAQSARWLALLPWLPRAVAIMRKRGGKPRPAYDEIPVRALASMIDLQRVVRAELAGVRAPALLLQGGLDETVAPRTFDLLESRLGSATKERRAFPASGHILPDDVEAPAVAEAVSSFFRETLATAG